MAETWASRLKPAAGNVIISPSDINGKTLFRVRVIGLPDRAAAQQVARQLEAEQRVSELWVGKD
jgi:cell division septation protein DedD